MLQKDLEQLSKWADIWQMDFNAAKCHLLSVTRKLSPLKNSYSIGGVPLKQVTHHPYLGVELSEDLNWGNHVNNVAPKAQRTLNFLRRNLSGCSQDTKAAAYNTLVRPVLEYGSSAWDPFQVNHIKKLEGIQRRAARFVTGQHQSKCDRPSRTSELEDPTREKTMCASEDAVQSHKWTGSIGYAIISIPLHNQ